MRCRFVGIVLFLSIDKLTGGQEPKGAKTCSVCVLVHNQATGWTHDHLESRRRRRRKYRATVLHTAGRKNLSGLWHEQQKQSSKSSRTRGWQGQNYLWRPFHIIIYYAKCRSCFNAVVSCLELRRDTSIMQGTISIPASSHSLVM